METDRDTDRDGGASCLTVVPTATDALTADASTADASAADASAADATANDNRPVLCDGEL